MERPSFSRVWPSFSPLPLFICVIYACSFAFSLSFFSSFTCTHSRLGCWDVSMHSCLHKYKYVCVCFNQTHFVSFIIHGRSECEQNSSAPLKGISRACVCEHVCGKSEQRRNASATTWTDERKNIVSQDPSYILKKNTHIANAVKVFSL